MEFYYASMENEILILRADGGLNAAAAEPMLQELTKLIEGGVRKIVVDCSHLDFVSSFGLGILVRLHAKMANQGGDVKLAGIKGVIAKVLHLTRLDKTFDIHPDVDSATKAFDS